MSSHAFSQAQSLPNPGKNSPVTDQSSGDDGDYLAEESEGEPDVLGRGMHVLGLSKKYVLGWKCKDAFREFYQNW